MRRITPLVCRGWTTASIFRCGAVAHFSVTSALFTESSRFVKTDGRMGAPVSSTAYDPPPLGEMHGGRRESVAPSSVTTPPETKGPIDDKEDISLTGAQGEVVKIEPLSSFDSLQNLPRWLDDGVKSLGFSTPSVIQKFTIPALQKGHDIIGLAPTGSGKTVAFAIPALQHLKPTQSGSPSVLVLAPTRELVQQTTKVFEKLSRGQARIAEAYGGTPREIQARKLHRGCDVLVACPGRLKDFLDSGDVSLSNLSFLVFDEADRLLDMGFQIQLDEILSYVEPTQQVQRMMWSATWPAAVQDLARAYLSPERLLIRAGTAGTGAQVNEHIKQRVMFVEGFQDRVAKLVELIESGEIDENTAKLIIFVERQSDTEEVAHALSRKLGIDTRYVGVLHGGLSQRRRDLVMNDFKSNHIRLLVATDVASRGLDIPDVTCVINFQAPQNIDSYCHRIGRTGRAGRNGDAFTFLGRQDGGISTELIDYLRRCKMEVPSGLMELEARHVEESRSRRRYGGKSGQSRFSPNRNRFSNQRGRGGGGGGARGRFGAPSSVSHNASGSRSGERPYSPQHYGGQHRSSHGRGGYSGSNFDEDRDNGWM